jgi:hypothetical protein
MSVQVTKAVLKDFLCDAEPIVLTLTGAWGAGSDLLIGKTEKFSLDMLITLASRVGCKVELSVE